MTAKPSQVESLNRQAQQLFRQGLSLPEVRQQLAALIEKARLEIIHGTAPAAVRLSELQHPLFTGTPTLGFNL